MNATDDATCTKVFYFYHFDDYFITINEVFLNY